MSSSYRRRTGPNSAQRVQVDQLNRQQRVRPVAAPVARPTTVRAPDRSNSYTQLAEAIAAFQPEFEAMGQQRLQEYAAEQEALAQGKIGGMTFEEATQAMKDGTIRQSESPWFQAAFNRQYGQRLATEAKRQALEKYRSIDFTAGQTVDDIIGEVQTELEPLIGGNALIQTGYMNEAADFFDRLRSQAADDFSKYQVKEAYNNHIVVTKEALDEVVPKGGLGYSGFRGNAIEGVPPTFLHWLDRFEAGRRGYKSVNQKGSGASGRGQFTQNNWNRYKKANPEAKKYKTKADAPEELQDQAIAWLYNEKATILQNMGIEATPRNVAIAWRFGPVQASRLLKMSPNDSVSDAARQGNWYKDNTELAIKQNNWEGKTVAQALSDYNDFDNPSVSGSNSWGNDQKTEIAARLEAAESDASLMLNGPQRTEARLNLAEQYAMEGNLAMAQYLLTEERIGVDGERLPPVIESPEHFKKARKILGDSLSSANQNYNVSRKNQAVADAIRATERGDELSVRDVTYIDAQGKTQTIKRSTLMKEARNYWAEHFKQANDINGYYRWLGSNNQTDPQIERTLQSWREVAETTIDSGMVNDEVIQAYRVYRDFKHQHRGALGAHLSSEDAGFWQSVDLFMHKYQDLEDPEAYQQSVSKAIIDTMRHQNDPVQYGQSRQATQKELDEIVGKLSYNGPNYFDETDFDDVKNKGIIRAHAQSIVWKYTRMGNRPDDVVDAVIAELDGAYAIHDGYAYRIDTAPFKEDFGDTLDDWLDEWERENDIPDGFETVRLIQSVQDPNTMYLRGFTGEDDLDGIDLQERVTLKDLEEFRLRRNAEEIERGRQPTEWPSLGLSIKQEYPFLGTVLGY